MHLVADLPQGYRLQLTDGETDGPSNAAEYYIGIVDDDGQEVMTVFSHR